ncbi:MAG: NUDIX hydrolase [Desulfobacteraceae bacterium]|nr:NUDIX hydrolase [Desulfobacteraceae bacterium]
MSVKINSSVTLHQGRVFTLLKENITLGNGITIDLDIIRHPGASAIVPISRNNTVIFIKQYRHAVRDFIWEIPAGTFNPPESPLECAKRELIEEIGFSGNVWHKLGVITPLPGYSDECIHIFLATDLVPDKQNLDKDEMLDVHEIGLADATKMIYNGSIQDGKTISGIFMATLWLKDNRLVTD